MAESFVDTFKTELIADRVWTSRSQLELAIVQWVAWFNNDRLHESLGDIPPAEFETAHELEASRAQARNRRRRRDERHRWPLGDPVRSDSPLQRMKRGNHQTRSARNPARLR